MRTTIALIVAGLCAFAIAGPVTKPYYKVGDKVFLEKQKDVLRLFNYINQPSYYKDFVEIADAFKFEGMYQAQWTKPEYAKEFYHMYQKDFLPQGEIFSVFYPEHLEQAIALFKTFYYAKDYETFYKTAVWARQNVNEGMFIYAYSVAIVHCKFTEGIVLPAIYEIYPHYFFNDEVIYKAQQYKQHYWGTYEHEEEIKDSFKGHTLQANYSGWYMNVHPEQSMSYFTEDIGVNAYYYYYGIFAPWWLPSEIIDYETTHRGEYFYWFHQQFLARYYLERLSNDMGEIPHYSYEYPIETGYYPSMHYPNGLHFPTRPNHAELFYHSTHGQQSYPWYGNYTESHTYVKDYERRLRDALDRGFFYTPEGKMVYLFDKEGFETLGNLVESNFESDNSRFYGDLLVFARHFLGYAYHPVDEYKLAPAALEHFETSVRDPMFWQMFKRIMYYFNQHQQYTGPYEKKQLFWEGLKIEDVTVDRLMTYFDYFYSDISNALVMDEKEFNEDSYLIRARQYRLNHKAFNYKIAVQADKSVEAFVKVFIGPKYDEYGREIDMDLNRHNFFEFDRFHYTLQAGKNVIERNSHESMYFSHDRTTYLELYQQVMTSINGGSDFKYFPETKVYGFPHRMLLPKGDFGGKTYQMFFMIAPFHANTKSADYQDDFGFDYFVDHEYTLGYPLDRPIEYEQSFIDIPNFYFKDVTIYHKNTEAEINTSYSQH
jgi:hypothetical protein